MGRRRQYKGEYKRKYDHALIDHLESGHTYETFAAVCNISLAELYRWEKKYPTFCKAKALGKPKQVYFWEKKAFDHLENPKGFNTRLFEICVRNFLGWDCPTRNMHYGEKDEQKETLIINLGGDNDRKAHCNGNCKQDHDAKLQAGNKEDPDK